MEVEIMSSTTSRKREASDSNSSNSAPIKHTSKRQKQHGNCLSSKYKGVVPHQNGHWGAQIYANQQRIWLGTFKTEVEAAAAYDSAALKLRRLEPTSTDGHRNFPWTHHTMYHEPTFQAHYTTEQVLNMIKDGSYQTKFFEYLASISQVGTSSNTCQTIPNKNYKKNQIGQKEGYFCHELFRKELTPSDVGKLNRLVIPKRYALKYFPIMSSHTNQNIALSFIIGQRDDNGTDMELIFYDKSMRNWTFRYCYWKSSQSFVFTRGWNKFVKEKKLKAKDIVSFYMCEWQENKNGSDLTKFCMIDIVASCVGLDKEITSDSKGVVPIHEEEIRLSNNREEGKGIRLFGVHIVANN